MPPHHHQEAHVINPIPTAAGPGLSPDFNKAKQISSIMTIILAVGFWGTLAWLAVLPLSLMWPGAVGWGGLWQSGVVIAPGSLSVGARAGALAAIVLSVAPSLLALHYAIRAFANFAKGRVFVPATIAHLRAIGLWLIVAGFASGFSEALFNVFARVTPVAHDLDFRPVLIVFGIGISVAAYVMAEAQRIADDNAAII
jgi:hypothetical protein